MNKRVFISFAMEDKWARDYLVGQSKNERVPFEFVDMSVKEPWGEKWKTQCRDRIKGCHGLIALVSRNTRQAAGQLWEIDTALTVGLPVRGIYTTQDDRPAQLPIQLHGIRIAAWTWDNVKTFVQQF